MFSRALCHITSNEIDILCRTKTTTPADDSVLMSLDDTYAYVQKLRTHLTMKNWRNVTDQQDRHTITI